MSIQPLFIGPFFAPSQQLQTSFAGGSGAEQPDEVSINAGPNLGNIFDGRGHDFLDPDSIQATTDDFSRTITSRVSDTLLSRLIGGNVNPLGKNPDSIDILNGTISGLNLVNSITIGQGLTPRANSNPFSWINPTALDIQLGVTFSGGSLVTGSPIAFPGTGIGTGTGVIPRAPFDPFTPRSSVFPGIPGNGMINPINHDRQNIFPIFILNYIGGMASNANTPYPGYFGNNNMYSNQNNLMPFQIYM